MQGIIGNHLEITSNDVICLYAHCKTIYVKEGEEVKQGTEIAEVGQTGRATRTSFAFRNKGGWKACKSRICFKFLTERKIL